MRKPILLLDVDGVLAPGFFGERSDNLDWSFEPIVATDEASGQFRVMLSREMGAALMALDVDIHWLTTWRHHANTQIGPRIGLPQLPVLGDDNEEWPWKVLEVLKMLLRKEGPVFWIDDDALGYVASANLQSYVDDGDLIVICPDPTYGIRRHDIEYIAKVCGSLRRRAGR